MFSAIAPRYDLLNHLLSLNIDKAWRRRAVSRLAPALEPAGSRCLDLCCGTGDLALEVASRIQCPVTGSDFSHSMLQLFQQKQLQNSVATIPILEADALSLPIPDRCFNGITIAFGLRNLENLETGLKEMCRVLKPGGRLVILEFTRPTNPLFSLLFQFYFFRILPWIGQAISRHGHAYTYLPHSVKVFPNQQALAQLMRQSGFENVQFENLTGGIAALHWGDRSQA
jgi:demethylmenaquinone methyltransferase / 2-methoxy-6-polyprenyl-1,4-benzoquinol methylase